MTARAAAWRGAWQGLPWLEAAGAAALLAGSLAAAAAFLVIGWWAFVLPPLAVGLAVAIRSPGTAAGVMALVAIAFEPGKVDPTATIGNALWIGPPGMETLPVGPLELFLLGVTALLWARRSRLEERPPLPLVVWAVPALMFLGYLYGVRKGAPPNLAYHEARGLLFAGIAFATYRLMSPLERARAARLVVAGTVLMALVFIGRYFFVIAPGRTSVPVTSAYSHEGAVILALAVILAGVGFVRADSGRVRGYYVAYALLLLVAILVTGRRAATLALIIGGLVAAWHLVPRRPTLMIGVLTPIMVIGVAYLGVFWSREYGALAQPARAIRSQIDPSPRDFSSDRYRRIELANIFATIDRNPAFGVGFGKPYAAFAPLPDLTGWWPLQSYVTHQNILWLWLKMGFLGITAFLTMWVLAVAHCARAVRESPERVPLVPIVVSAGLFIVFAYASVDAALAETRSAVFAGVLVAAAFTFPVWKES